MPAPSLMNRPPPLLPICLRRHTPPLGRGLAAALIGAALPALLSAATAPALAQVSDANVRALNVARSWAINANGGLAQYVPAACMFQTASGGGVCLLRSSPQGFLFRFNGGPPGWQQQGLAPNRQSELLISPDGRSVLNVVYNGPPR